MPFRVVTLFILSAASITFGVAWEGAWIYHAGAVALGIGLYFFAEAMIEGYWRKWGWLGSMPYAVRFGVPPRKVDKPLWLSDGFEPEWEWPQRVAQSPHGPTPREERDQVGVLEAQPASGSAVV